MSKNNKSDFSQLVQSGFARMAESRVSICGLARDCQRKLTNIAPQIVELGECFRSYSINIVENDSKDGTSEFLSCWSANNPNVCLIQFSSCPWIADLRSAYAGPNWWFSKTRMQRMNFARNLYLGALQDEDFIDFVIVIDLDIQSFSLAGIAHSFGLKEQWDFVAGNGRRYSIRHPFRKQVYWDTYVYEPKHGFLGGILNKTQISKAQVQIAKMLGNRNLLAVKSAFGGLCIYRREAIGNHRYIVVKNDDYEVEVLCDHTTLHREMAKAGCQQGYINPLQTVSYETATIMLRRFLARS